MVSPKPAVGAATVCFMLHGIGTANRHTSPHADSRQPESGSRPCPGFARTGLTDYSGVRFQVRRLSLSDA